MAPSEDSMEDSVFASSHGIGIPFVGLQLYHSILPSSSHGLLPCVRLCVSSPLLIKTLVSGFRAHSSPLGPFLNELHMQNPIYKRPHSEVSGRCKLLGDTIQSTVLTTYEGKKQTKQTCQTMQTEVKVF